MPNAFIWGIVSFIYYKVAFAAAFQPITIIASLLLACMTAFFTHITAYDWAVKEGRHHALLRLSRPSTYFRHTLFGLALVALLSAVLGKLILYGFSDALSRRISGSALLYKFKWESDQAKAFEAISILIGPLLLHYLITMGLAFRRVTTAGASKVDALSGSKTPSPSEKSEPFEEDEWADVPGEPFKRWKQIGEPLDASEREQPIVAVVAKADGVRDAKGISNYLHSNEKGDLRFVRVDCSDGTNATYGNDLAMELLIEGQNQAHFLYAALNKKRSDFATMSPSQILEQVVARFPEFFGLEEWLLEKKLPYRELYNSWA